MKALSFTLWVAALVWLVLVAVGALQFQQMYGGSSGSQVVLLGVAVGLIPVSLAWWVYRRAR